MRRAVFFLELVWRQAGILAGVFCVKLVAKAVSELLAET